MEPYSPLIQKRKKERKKMKKKTKKKNPERNEQHLNALQKESLVIKLFWMNCETRWIISIRAAYFSYLLTVVMVILVGICRFCGRLKFPNVQMVQVWNVIPTLRSLTRWRGYVVFIALCAEMVSRRWVSRRWVSRRWVSRRWCLDGCLGDGCLGDGVSACVGGALFCTVAQVSSFICWS